MKAEPRIRTEANVPRAVQVVLPLDWAQAVTRLQQLHNSGHTDIRIVHDEQGHIRVEPVTLTTML